jgi:superfamily II DNA or RNA helicase
VGVAKVTKKRGSGATAEPGAAGVGFTLRPYQQELIDRCVAALKEKQSPLVVLPTGGGKTALVAEMARLSRVTGRRVVVICHRREIAHQIAAAIAHHTGHQPELATAGSKPDWNAPVLVAMVPTLARRAAAERPALIATVTPGRHRKPAVKPKVEAPAAPHPNSRASQRPRVNNSPSAQG